MVPVLFNMLMRGSVRAFKMNRIIGRSVSMPRRGISWCGSNRASSEDSRSFREKYRNALAWTLSEARSDRCGVRHPDRRLHAVSFRCWDGISFRRSMRDRCACTCARRPERAWRRRSRYFAEVEADIRHIVGNDQIDVMLDNIGLPYSGINIALSDSATVGPMDGEILISLNQKHAPTAKTHRHAAPGVARAISRSCNSSFSRPTSSIKSSISVSRRRSMSGFPGRIRAKRSLWRRRSRAP